MVPDADAGTHGPAVYGKAGLHHASPTAWACPGRRHSIGLARWWHLGIDTLWLLNGLIFYILHLHHGSVAPPGSYQLGRHPQCSLGAIQYVSLNWPTDNGWVTYNSLQVIAYFITVFIAAPLAFITGLGMSPALSTKFRRISRVFSIQVARSLHFLVLGWFLLFIVMHVSLVVTTEALRNLNHMYADRNDGDWYGFWIFAASMAMMIVSGWRATPLTYRHPRMVQRIGFALIGPAQRLFEHLDSKPGRYTEKDISPYFWHNGKYPESDRIQNAPRRQLRRLPPPGSTASSRTRWNSTWTSCAPCRTTSRSPSTSASRAGPASPNGAASPCKQSSTWCKPNPEAKWVIFYSFADGPDGGIYYDAQPDRADELPPDHARLRHER